jgi:putative endonuclease
LKAHNALKPQTAQQISGQAAEQAALEHLQAHGLRLVARNVLLRGGELDLVMFDVHTLVFVEVRSRAARGLVGALESITFTKQRRVVHAAQIFLAQHAEHARSACRFDIVGLTRDGDTMHIEWHKNAFEASTY